MDLTFTEEQNEIVTLADRILGDLCSPDRLRALETRGADAWPRDAWVALAEAGLVGLGLGGDVGGGDLGFLETALVVGSVARVAAPLPAYATLVLGADPIEKFGSTDQRQRWLPGVVDGSVVLTAALVGVDDSDDPVQGRRGDGGELRVEGVAWYVPHGFDAAAIVVPVTLDGGGSLLAVIPTGTDGVTLEPLAPMGGGPTSIVRFDGVVVDDGAVLEGSVDDGRGAVEWLRDRAVAATCVAQAGTCAGALTLTAGYVSTREQFGARLATLQAVSQRAADAWIDTELVRLTAWAAAWRLASGLDATDELAVAKVFTAEAAQRVVAAAQHLHGGIGMDLDYPVHRYFRWAKEHEQRLGGGAEHLDRLGRSLAGA